jgi:hypothetical protein
MTDAQADEEAMTHDAVSAAERSGLVASGRREPVG